MTAVLVVIIAVLVVGFTYVATGAGSPRGTHARDGQFRDDLTAWARRAAAWLRSLIADVELRLHWWDWEIARAHWYRQYKRADRKAFAAECDAIRARAIEAPAPALAPGQAQDPAVCPPWRPEGAAHPTPPRPVAPSPIAPGEGATSRHPWVITQPPPGSPRGWTPVGRVTLERPDGRITISDSGHVAVVPEPTHDVSDTGTFVVNPAAIAAWEARARPVQYDGDPGDPDASSRHRVYAAAGQPDTRTTGAMEQVTP